MLTAVQRVLRDAQDGAARDVIAADGDAFRGSLSQASRWDGGMKAKGLVDAGIQVRQVFEDALVGDRAGGTNLGDQGLCDLGVEAQAVE